MTPYLENNSNQPVNNSKYGESFRYPSNEEVKLLRVSWGIYALPKNIHLFPEWIIENICCLKYWKLSKYKFIFSEAAITCAKLVMEPHLFCRPIALVYEITDLQKIALRFLSSIFVTSRDPIEAEEVPALFVPRSARNKPKWWFAGNNSINTKRRIWYFLVSEKRGLGATIQCGDIKS